MNRYFKLVILFTVLLSSCKRTFEDPQWDVQVLAPLVKSSMTLKDILRDSSIKEENDKTYTLVKRNEISTFTIDSLVGISAPTYERTVNLQTLVLANQTVTRRISLGEIANMLKAQGNPNGQTIIDFHGKTLLFVPAINDITAGPFTIDVNQFFQSASLLGGKLDVTVQNGLPLTISNLMFNIKNAGSNTLITNQAFTNITPNATQTKTQDLAGMTVEGNLSGEITDMDINSGFNIHIDTSQALIISLRVYDLNVYEATAIFPEQDVVNETSNVPLLGLDDARLTSITLRQAAVEADVLSTVDDTVRFTYEIPGAFKDGQPFAFTVVVPPAPPNGVSHKIFSTDFSGYDIDLTGVNKDTFNNFYGVLKGKINYTGQVKTLSLEDSLVVSLALVNPKASYVKGYLGRDTIELGPSTEDFSSLVDIAGLQFESTKMVVSIENALGVPAIAKIIDIKSINSNTNTTVSLTGTALSTDFPILPAIETPFQSIVSTIDLSNNSNATDLINNAPTQMYYHGKFITNASGFDINDPVLMTQFAKSGVDVKAYIDAEIPLSIQANNLILKDTLSFNSSSIKNNGIGDGNYRFIVKNYFPLDVKVALYFYDATNNKIDSLVATTPFKAGVVNSTTGIVESPTTSSEVFFISEARMYQLLNHTAYLIGESTFDSMPLGQFVKLYSDYKLELELVGDFKYTVNK